MRPVQKSGGRGGYVLTDDQGPSIERRHAGFELRAGKDGWWTAFVAMNGTNEGEIDEAIEAILAWARECVEHDRRGR